MFSKLDQRFFKAYINEYGQESISFVIWRSYVVGLITGIVISAIDFFSNDALITDYINLAGLFATLLLAVIFLFRNYKAVEGTGVRIARGAFTIISCMGISFLGLITGLYCVVLIAIYFGIMIIIYFFRRIR